MAEPDQEVEDLVDQVGQVGLKVDVVEFVQLLGQKWVFPLCCAPYAMES